MGSVRLDRFVSPISLTSVISLISLISVILEAYRGSQAPQNLANFISLIHVCMRLGTGRPEDSCISNVTEISEESSISEIDEITEQKSL